MIVSNAHLQELATSIAKDVNRRNPKRLTHTICLEIVDGREHIAILIGHDGSSRVLEDGHREPAGLRLRASKDTAAQIKRGEMTVPEAITAGRIKVSGSVVEVMEMADELSLENELD